MGNCACVCFCGGWAGLAVGKHQCGAGAIWGLALDGWKLLNMCANFSNFLEPLFHFRAPPCLHILPSSTPLRTPPI